MITIIALLGKRWGRKWIDEGVMTEEEMLDLGYLGCFLEKFLDFKWMAKN